MWRGAIGFEQIRFGALTMRIVRRKEGNAGIRGRLISFYDSDVDDVLTNTRYELCFVSFEIVPVAEYQWQGMPTSEV